MRVPRCDFRPHGRPGLFVFPALFQVVQGGDERGWTNPGKRGAGVGGYLHLLGRNRSSGGLFDRRQALDEVDARGE